MRKDEVLKRLKEAWGQRGGPAVFSTTDKAGKPNSVYVLSMKLFDDGRVAVMDNRFHKTRENIKDGSRGAFLFLAREHKAYQVKGRLEYLESGPLFEAFRAEIEPRFARRAAVVLYPEEIYCGAEKLL